MKWMAGAAVAASLWLVTLASHAMPADSAAAPPAQPPAAAAADSATPSTQPPAAKKPKPPMHPKTSPAKPAASAVHDTLSPAVLKSLKLPPPPPPPKGRPPKVLAVALDVRHMVFGNFREHAIVGMKQDFRVGDSDYTARIVEFVPDWAMGLQTFKVYNRSNEPNNPAFRIVVRGKGAERDTVWAFMHMPPHFARHSMLSFKVVRIEFADHTPVPNTAPDSATARATRPTDSTTVHGGKP